MEMLLDVFRTVADFFNQHGIVGVCAVGGGIVVGLAFLVGIAGDVSKIFRDIAFERWLAKDDNFTRFGTLGEARRGYRRHLQEREYAAHTRSLARRRERRLMRERGEKPEPFRVRLARRREAFGRAWDAASERAYDIWTNAEARLSPWISRARSASSRMASRIGKTRKAENDG